jgi:hypothetical protein
MADGAPFGGASRSHGHPSEHHKHGVSANADCTRTSTEYYTNVISAFGIQELSERNGFL